MKYVELAEGISSSVLGFGCSSILGSVGAAQSSRALDCALDCGINHFDLARSYGYGEAESFVGKLLKGKRSQIVIASKFGIRANWKAQVLRPLKPLIRYVRSEKPKYESVQNRNAVTSHAISPDMFHDRVSINIREMRKSLEQSLNALQTDYLDYFFIHEPITELNDFEKISELAEILKKEGKIRAWGLAFLDSQKDLHEKYVDSFDVLQFNCKAIKSSNYKIDVRQRGDRANVLFSPFRGESREVTPKDKLKYLLNDFPKSVILCSMFDEKHIINNSKIVSNQ
ncbi:aldo/keto reductase [Salmonirosea aquatica]|uniref:Aldo/keto reductase n=1 Tax=Salmonirosea aquatica TaxID=2654236 RepID=A0A7C9FX31_9BACT|nr:aldo/keto reductase [Cytophagaceae bacterium SJW1-29]